MKKEWIYPMLLGKLYNFEKEQSLSI